jgi:hypothetical protein
MVQLLTATRLCAVNIFQQSFTQPSVSLKIYILPQMTVTGAESSGRVDYAIKKIIDGRNNLHN